MGKTATTGHTHYLLRRTRDRGGQSVKKKKELDNRVRALDQVWLDGSGSRVARSLAASLL